MTSPAVPSAASAPGHPSRQAWVLFAAATAYLIKLAGYLLPQSFLDRPDVHELAAALTVGLLASLTVMNTLGKGQAVALDARLSEPMAINESSPNVARTSFGRSDDPELAASPARAR